MDPASRVDWTHFGFVAAALLFPIAVLSGGAAAVSGESPGAEGGAAERPEPVPAETAAGVDPERGPDVGASVERVGSGDVLRYDVTVERLAGTDRFAMVLGRNAVVERVEGLERVDGDGRTRLRWTGDGSSARVVVRADVSSVAAAESTPQFYATDGWVLGPVPFLEVQWVRDSGPLQRDHPLRDDGNLRSTGPAWFGDRYALVGQYRADTDAGGGQSFTLVSPRGTETAPDRAAVFSALGAAAADLEVGSEDDTVLLYALPDPARGGESIPVRAEAWVEADAPLADPNSVWLHEYVHTRQSFRLAADMRWFREASAEYYAARLAERQGLVDEAAVRRHLGGEPSQATLTRPETWSHQRVPYRKGGRVLALLDHDIRVATDGERTLQDVFRRLNGHEGRVDYERFRTVVSDVAGRPMGAWLDRYVAGGTPVAGLYTESALDAGFVGPQDDSPGPTRGEAFFLVSVALSVVAAVPLYYYLRGRPDCERRRPEVGMHRRSGPPGG